MFILGTRRHNSVFQLARDERPLVRRNQESLRAIAWQKIKGDRGRTRRTQCKTIGMIFDLFEYIDIV